MNIQETLALRAKAAYTMNRLMHASVKDYLRTIYGVTGDDRFISCGYIGSIYGILYLAYDHSVNDLEKVSWENYHKRCLNFTGIDQIPDDITVGDLMELAKNLLFAARNRSRSDGSGDILEHELCEKGKNILIKLIFDPFQAFAISMYLRKYPGPYNIQHGQYHTDADEEYIDQ